MGRRAIGGRVGPLKKTQEEPPLSDFELARRIHFILAKAERSPKPERRRRKGRETEMAAQPQTNEEETRQQAAIARAAEEKALAAEARAQVLEQRALAAEAIIASGKENRHGICDMSLDPPSRVLDEGEERKALAAAQEKASVTEHKLRVAEARAWDMEQRALAAEAIIAQRGESGYSSGRFR